MAILNPKTPDNNRFYILRMFSTYIFICAIQ